MVNFSGPLYSRDKKAKQLRQDLESYEEILNHFFDLTFAIAPDHLIQDLLLKHLNIQDDSSFESIGQEIRQRYEWGESTNVTQPDSLFVSDNTIMAAELKLGSTSWPEQIMKYVALMLWEELHSGPKTNLGLLFMYVVRVFWTQGVKI